MQINKQNFMSTSSMVKSIIFFTIILVLALYILTNLFFSYELRIRHEESVKRIQQRMRAEDRRNHHPQNQQQPEQNHHHITDGDDGEKGGGTKEDKHKKSDYHIDGNEEMQEFAKFVKNHKNELLENNSEEEKQKQDRELKKNAFSNKVRQLMKDAKENEAEYRLLRYELKHPSEDVDEKVNSGNLGQSNQNNNNNKEQNEYLNNEELGLAQTTTRTPEAKKSNHVHTRKILVPLSLSSSSSSSVTNNQNNNKRLFRTLQVQDTSLMLRNTQNWKALREHYIRSAQHFFPEDMAKEWRKRMLESWTDPAAREANWVFATNNDGKKFGRKVMSRDNIPERKKLAKREHMWNRNSFCYTKWEMQRKHPLHLQVKKFMTTKETKNAICLMLAEDCPKDFVEKSTLGDFFISFFEHDDFLAPHSDLSLGSITIAGHFLVDTSSLPVDEHKSTINNSNNNNNNNNNNNQTDSGAVEFKCADTNSWCVKMKASKNELIVFKTQPDSAEHQVTQMTDPKYLRFGITGFYAMPGENQLLEY